MARKTLLVLWTCALFIMTCASAPANSGRLITFAWEHDPVLAEFFSPLPSSPDEEFLLRKLGHILAFGLLSILAAGAFRLFPAAFLFSLICAISTEVLQLYFSRGGRLFDVGFDLIGILAGLLYAGAAAWMSNQGNRQVKRGTPR
jgi:VanZ family protein